MNVVGISGISGVKSNQNFGQLVTTEKGADVLGNQLRRCNQAFVAGFENLVKKSETIPGQVIFDGEVVRVAGDDSFVRKTSSPLTTIVHGLNLVAEKAAKQAPKQN
jgi:hypothetical protein